MRYYQFFTEHWSEFELKWDGDEYILWREKSAVRMFITNKYNPILGQ